MTRIGIIGAAGRMGQTLIRCIESNIVEGLELAAAIDQPDHADIGKEVRNGVAISGDLGSALEACDVFIDFSFHTATPDNARRIAEAGKRVVIGTTGLTPDEERAITDASSKVAIVMAPNMSLGINLLLSLVEQAAAALRGKGYDVEIVERHHRRKKDAPSGTALALGDAAARGLQWNLKDVAVDGRGGVADSDRPVEEIGFHAVRGGDYVGDHTVLFAAEGESIELSHRATQRDTFAVGALRAGAWVATRDPGLYTMKDVLGI